MNIFEEKIARSFEDHGWFTEILEEANQNKPRINILAYKPKTGKTFYGDLAEISTSHNEYLLP
jgi:hypothetical protein